MPWWMLIYFVLILLMLLFDFVFSLYFRCRIWYVCYSFLASLYFLLFAAAYWLPKWQEGLTLYHAPLFFFLLIFEFQLTVLTSPEQLGIRLSEQLSEYEMDVAKAFSAIIMLPAYICGVLLCHRILNSVGA